MPTTDAPASSSSSDLSSSNVQEKSGERVMDRYTLEVPAEASGDRIDRWVASQLDLSRSRIQSLIGHGKVECNGQLCTDKKMPIETGDRIDIAVPPPLVIELAPEVIPLDILFEDKHLLVVNKPKGMVVHPGAGHPNGTLVNALLHHCTDLSGINGEQRPGIVHRLDKDTSGALVVAKSDRVHQHLQGQIQAKTARREYLGVVFGRPRVRRTHSEDFGDRRSGNPNPSDESGTVDAPIGRHPQERKKMAVVPLEKGRHAVTHWKLLEALGNYSLMHFQLETGRTHQIRVHCAHMGNPIVGDPLYTSSRQTPVKLTGQALHAWKLTFEHPITGEVIATEAPAPEEFHRLTTKLRQS